MAAVGIPPTMENPLQNRCSPLFARKGRIEPSAALVMVVAEGSRLFDEDCLSIEIDVLCKVSGETSTVSPLFAALIAALSDNCPSRYKNRTKSPSVRRRNGWRSVIATAFKIFEQMILEYLEERLRAD